MRYELAALVCVALGIWLADGYMDASTASALHVRPSTMDRVEAVLALAFLTAAVALVIVGLVK